MGYATAAITVAVQFGQQMPGDNESLRMAVEFLHRELMHMGPCMALASMGDYATMELGLPSVGSALGFASTVCNFRPNGTGPKTSKPASNSVMMSASNGGGGGGGSWKSPVEWANHDHRVLVDQVRVANRGYETGRHNMFSRAMGRALKRMADAAERRGVLPEYVDKLREMAITYEKRARAGHPGGNRR